MVNVPVSPNENGIHFHVGGTDAAAYDAVLHGERARVIESAYRKQVWRTKGVPNDAPDNVNAAVESIGNHTGLRS